MLVLFVCYILMPSSIKLSENCCAKIAELSIYVSAEVTTFAGSGEPGFHDDVGIRAKMTNPQHLELDNLKRRLFVSDTVS